MTITFNINYRTSYGEEIMVHIRPTDGAEATVQHNYRLSTRDGLHWTCRIDNFPLPVGTVFDYHYTVVHGERELRSEWTTVAHRLELSAPEATHYVVDDEWHDMPEDTYRYSSAFTDCISRHAAGPQSTVKSRRTLRLIVRAPQIRRGERLAVTGSDHLLGDWDTGRAVDMWEHNYNEWTVDIDATRLQVNPLELKFLAVSDRDGTALWETGSNHQLAVGDIADGEVRTVMLGQAFFEICDERLAGTLVPVFSLRSDSSFGVGDFGDLKKMIDWVAETRQRVLQVLPINDTTTTHTWTDSYPYSCISVFALHPQYADLTQLPPIRDDQKREAMEQLRLELNALPQIDYERVNAAKTECLRLAYEQEGKRVLKTAEFQRFFDRSQHWLVPYAQYCTLRDEYGTADFSRWPDHRQWDERQRQPLSNPRSPAYRKVAYHYYVQFVLSRQMEAVHDYAVSRGVVLKGDIPIGVSRYGCDVWHEPDYFNLNGQAGAPPDAFSTNGQDWGFPTYNWERMLEDGCQWWVRRFQYMAHYFDAYRIDHVLGFFRIWEIPIDSVHGLTGQFSPSLGMTAEEIEAYGLHFQEQLFTTPFIADWTVDRIFGERAAEVKDKYLDRQHDDILALKPEYATQRQIEAAFQGHDSEADRNLRDGLYALASNVLFVRDRREKGKYHPRITAQLDFMYEALCDTDKAAFNRLYDDYYYRRNNYFWYREAMKKLPTLVQATRMLVCAEDLGMVPDCVPWVMNELRVLSMEVQSMPKDSSLRFGFPSRYPYRSVNTLSTHDMPTLRQWWDEDWDRTQDYYCSMLYRGGGAPHPLPGWLARDILSRQLASPSMLCVQSLQDWLSIDEQLRLPDADAERINIPANPRHYWRYRMHLSIEQLQASKAYNDTIKELVGESGRR